MADGRERAGQHDHAVDRPRLDRRRFLLGAGAAMVAPSLLSACTSGQAAGGSTSSTSAEGTTSTTGRGGGGEELSFWNFYGPDDQGSPRSQWWVEMADEWNRNNSVQIRLNYVPVADYVNGTALQTAFTSGGGPDIFLVSAGDFLRYANEGVLTDIRPAMSQEAYDDFTPASMATRQVGNQVLALPTEASPLLMYYSVAAFESTGLSEADVPGTWDELFAVAEQLTNAQRFGVLFETQPGYYQNFTWYPFLWAAGGEVVNEAGTTSMFDSPATVRALDFWKETIERGIAPRTANGRSAADITANLVAGSCAMQNTTVSLVQTLRDTAPDYQFGVFPLPVPAGASPVTSNGGWSYAANARGKNPEVAAEFIAWALADMSSEGVDRVRRWDTEVSSYIPVRQSVITAAEDEGYFEDPVLRTVLDDIFPTGRSEPRFPPDVYQPVSDAIQDTQLGGSDSTAAAARAHEEISSFLESYDGARIL